MPAHLVHVETSNTSYFLRPPLDEVRKAPKELGSAWSVERIGVEWGPGGWQEIGFSYGEYGGEDEPSTANTAL